MMLSMCCSPRARVLFFSCCTPLAALYMMLSTCCSPRARMLFSSCFSPLAALHMMLSMCCSPRARVLFFSCCTPLAALYITLPHDAVHVLLSTCCPKGAAHHLCFLHLLSLSALRAFYQILAHAASFHMLLSSDYPNAILQHVSTAQLCSSLAALYLLSPPCFPSPFASLQYNRWSSCAIQVLCYI